MPLRYPLIKKKYRRNHSLPVDKCAAEHMYVHKNYVPLPFFKIGKKKFYYFTEITKITVHVAYVD